MATYARLQDGMVAELFTTGGDITKLFPRAMVWLDVTSTPDAAVGWTAQGGVVSPPARAFPQAVQATPVVAAPIPATLTLATVQTQLTALQAQVTQLAAAAVKA